MSNTEQPKFTPLQQLRRSTAALFLEVPEAVATANREIVEAAIADFELKQSSLYEALREAHEALRLVRLHMSIPDAGLRIAIDKSSAAALSALELVNK